MATSRAARHVVDDYTAELLGAQADRVAKVRALREHAIRYARQARRQTTPPVDGES